MTDPGEPRRDGPTEVVETDSGELVERLSGGTATLLLVWLIGVGALSGLLAAWLFVWAISGERLGLGALFGSFGFYVGIGGATGPTVLWLSGRAQGHSLAWFLGTAAKIALTIVALLAVVVAITAFLMAGIVPGPGAFLAAGMAAAFGLALSVVWGLATWAADRWIARARAPEG